MSRPAAKRDHPTVRAAKRAIRRSLPRLSPKHLFHIAAIAEYLLENTRTGEYWSMVAANAASPVQPSYAQAKVAAVEAYIDQVLRESSPATPAVWRRRFLTGGA